MLGAACACQARRTYRYLVELVCTLCSRVVAIAVINQPGAPIRIPRQVRCFHCGGQPMAGETTRQVVYPSVPREQPRAVVRRAGWWTSGASKGLRHDHQY